MTQGRFTSAEEADTWADQQNQPAPTPAAPAGAITGGVSFNPYQGYDLGGRLWGAGNALTFGGLNAATSGIENLTGVNFPDMSQNAQEEARTGQFGADIGRDVSATMLTGGAALPIIAGGHGAENLSNQAANEGRNFGNFNYVGAAADAGLTYAGGKLPMTMGGPALAKLVSGPAIGAVSGDVSSGIQHAADTGHFDFNPLSDQNRGAVLLGGALGTAGGIIGARAGQPVTAADLQADPGGHTGEPSNSFTETPQLPGGQPLALIPRNSSAGQPVTAGNFPTNPLEHLLQGRVELQQAFDQADAMAAQPLPETPQVDLSQYEQQLEQARLATDPEYAARKTEQTAQVQDGLRDYVAKALGILSQHSYPQGNQPSLTPDDLVKGQAVYESALQQARQAGVDPDQAEQFATDALRNFVGRNHAGPGDGATEPPKSTGSPKSRRAASAGHVSPEIIGQLPFALARTVQLTAAKVGMWTGRILRKAFNSLAPSRIGDLYNSMIAHYVHSSTLLPLDTQSALTTATGSVLQPTLSRNLDPVTDAFKRADYQPKLHAEAMFRLWDAHQDNLEDIANAPTSTYQLVFGKHYTSEMEAAMRLAAQVLQRLPNEAGFLGSFRYSLKRHSFSPNGPVPFNVMGGHSTVNGAVGDDWVRSFIKYSSDNPDGRSVQNQDPFHTLQAHITAAAMQKAYNPIETQAIVNGKKVTTTQEMTPWKQLEGVKDDPNHAPETKRAAQYTQDLISGKAFDHNANFLERLQDNALSTWLGMNFGPVLQASSAHLAIAPGGLRPDYNVMGALAATKTGVVREALSSMGFHGATDLSQVLKELRISSAKQYFQDYISPYANDWSLGLSISGPLDRWVRNLTAATTLMDSARKYGIPIREVLENQTSAAQQVRGEVVKMVRDIHGTGDPISRIRIASHGIGKGAYVAQTAHMSQQNFILHLLRTCKDLPTLMRVGRALGVKVALGGTKGVASPDFWLAAATAWAATGLHQNDDPGAMWVTRQLDKAQSGQSDFPWPGLLEHVDNQVNTNLASKTGSMLDPEAYIPGSGMSDITQSFVRGAQVYQHPESVDPNENFDATVAAGAALLTPTSLGPYAQIAARAASAQRHIQSGFRMYDGQPYPVNPAGEMASVVVGGSGPGGNKQEMLKKTGDEVYRSVYHDFQAFLQQHPNLDTLNINQIPPHLQERFRTFVQAYGSAEYPHLDQGAAAEAIFKRLTTPTTSSTLANTLKLYGEATKAFNNGDRASAAKLRDAAQHGIDQMQQDPTFRDKEHPRNMRELGQFYQDKYAVGQ